VVSERGDAANVSLQRRRKKAEFGKSKDSRKKNHDSEEVHAHRVEKDGGRQTSQKHIAA
jgi:hypothetical protein